MLLFFFTDLIPLHELREDLVAWSCLLSLIHDRGCSAHVVEHALLHCLVKSVD